MTAERSRPWPSAWLWLVVSAVVHATLLLLALRARVELPETPHFELPSAVQFGMSDGPRGNTAEPAPAAAPPPAKPPAKPKASPKRSRPAPDPDAITLAPDAGPSGPNLAEHQPEDGAERNQDSEREAAVSGMGLFEGASGDGSGSGPGGGTGSGDGVLGATVALNVDLVRVRDSALLLETQALLDIIPEWQGLLAGSGLDPLQDFARVFIAAPSTDRASLIVSAQHALSRERVASAVTNLAAERGTPAAFRTRSGLAVAAWANRGPTARVIALLAPDQLVITRAPDLERVLSVSQALAQRRRRQGFDPSEVDRSGGLLAMQRDEAVALWVEGVSRYVRGAVEGVPEALRMSIFRVDQFSTELKVSGSYRSRAQAEAAFVIMDGLRKELSDHPRVVFLGLKSAMDSALIEQHDATLSMRVRLTLHQTRYLMGFVSRALRPR